MPLTVAERNAIADFEGARLLFVSLHTADPGTTGASEASGAPYARKALTFPAAANGSTVSAEATVDVGAGTFTHFGTWPTATGGTFRGGNALPTSETFNAAGQLKVTLTVPVTAT
jgi:hypothetical protein